MRMVCAALALTALASAACARDAVGITHYAQGGWWLTVADDHFTGERRCLVETRSGAMLYQPGAIGFRVRRRDTLGAIYRIDDGPVVRWQDRYPLLVAAGVEVEGPGLDDPTDRLVWVPEGELRGARTVQVRAGGHGWGQRFRLGGAETVIAAARGLKCRIVTAF